MRHIVIKALKDIAVPSCVFLTSVRSRHRVSSSRLTVRTCTSRLPLCPSSQAVGSAGLLTTENYTATLRTAFAMSDKRHMCCWAPLCTSRTHRGVPLRRAPSGHAGARTKPRGYREGYWTRMHRCVPLRRAAFGHAGAWLQPRGSREDIGQDDTHAPWLLLCTPRFVDRWMRVRAMWAKGWLHARRALSTIGCASARCGRRGGSRHAALVLVHKLRAARCGR